MNHNYIDINIEKKRNSFENNDLSIKKCGRSNSIKRLTAIVNLIKTNGPTRLYALLDHYSQLILLLSALSSVSRTQMRKQIMTMIVSKQKPS